MLFIPFTFRGSPGKVFIKDINYITNEGRKICIDTVNDTVCFYGCIDSAVTPVLDERFHKCHGRLIINFTLVDEFETDGVRFYNGKRIKIGINNLRRARAQYRKYIERTALKMIGERKNKYIHMPNGVK